MYDACANTSPKSDTFTELLLLDKCVYNSSALITRVWLVHTCGT